MTTPVRQLRIVQVVCIFVTLFLVVFKGSLTHKNPGVTTLVHWFIAALGIYCASSGYKFQRILNRPARSQARTKSTPFSRWRAGHIARLYFAFSSALWAILLFIIGGPSWMVDTLFTLALLLLLLWSPGDQSGSSAT
jgi:hypothetical protein